jgi:hypothetical protein
VIHIYETTHRRNRIISRAFAAGCGGKVVPPAPLLPGTFVSYGVLRGLLPTFRQAVAEGRSWVYIDNAYFRRSGSDMQGYFRVTRNALQHDGSGSAKPDRWRRLGLEIKPWRKDGSHILICPPDAIYGRLWGLDVDRWLGSTTAMLKTATDRPIEVRRRDSLRKAKPFREALRDSWAVVTHQSNAAVEALLAGIPVFCTGACAAAGMGRSDPAMIEDPLLPDDRERWAAVLAANQWTVSEMADGTCWRGLNG